MKVFISASTFAQLSKEPLKLLKDKRLEFKLNPFKRRLSEQEICLFLKDDNYVGLIAGTEQITKKVLCNANSLKVISRVGVGLDNIDLKTTKKFKIKIFNTPDVLTDSVAELTMGLILCALRRISLMDRNMKRKIWNKEMGFLLKDKILGIIGFGKIGKKVSRLAKAFGSKVIYYDLKRFKPNKSAEKVTFSNLLKNSNIISIHCSGKNRIISNNEINKMKQGVILINTSRGTAIDENALNKGLATGRVSFAALDVFNSEPYRGRLSSLNNVILTPHVGSYAKEARIRIEIEAVNNLLKGLNLIGKRWKLKN
ncbi:MAG: phosphoglycerate dehydrogenase [Candidatus Omnitrophota bacterium]|nr:phosphoglycerate dehydrogenase [Candidatus Omnitrophota bacterium]